MKEKKGNLLLPFCVSVLIFPEELIVREENELLFLVSVLLDLGVLSVRFPRKTFMLKACDEFSFKIWASFLLHFRPKGLPTMFDGQMILKLLRSTKQLT